MAIGRFTSSILMYSEKDLVKECLGNNAKAHEEFYKRYATKMYGVCLRFAKNKMEADDILQEGFIKAFTNLKSFRNEGSLEGWVRRTIVNTAINHVKKFAKYKKDLDIDTAEPVRNLSSNAVDKISIDELLKLIKDLPIGYKMVFNLNVMEGYTHREIGALLDISENTSKSQLSRARHTLQRKVNEIYNNDRF
ncbi:MAG: hypothetical protein DRJ05_01285 [Bacteroidetes bacterium]|nr:MAG: hypothetical protein DRJ05_01285 [Bacteroidota bacterium]